MDATKNVSGKPMKISKRMFTNTVTTFCRIVMELEGIAGIFVIQQIQLDGRSCRDVLAGIVEIERQLSSAKFNGIYLMQVCRIHVKRQAEYTVASVLILQGIIIDAVYTE